MGGCDAHAGGVVGQGRESRACPLAGGVGIVGDGGDAGGVGRVIETDEFEQLRAGDAFVDDRAFHEALDHQVVVEERVRGQRDRRTHGSGCAGGEECWQQGGGGADETHGDGNSGFGAAVARRDV